MRMEAMPEIQMRDLWHHNTCTFDTEFPIWNNKVFIEKNVCSFDWSMCPSRIS
jgi:hypothetical protein